MLLIVLLLFLIGVSGLFLFNRHIIYCLISLEILILAVNINFILFSVILDDFTGQIYALILLSIAAAEISIGLSLLVVFQRLSANNNINLIFLLKS